MYKSSEITENQAKNIVVDQDDREVHDVKDDPKKPPGKLRGGKGKRKQTKKKPVQLQKMWTSAPALEMSSLWAGLPQMQTKELLLENVLVQAKGQL